MRAWRWGVVAVFAVVLVSSLAVGAGVLRQLGAPRLALSPTPLLDALAAADASALEPLVVVAVAVACGFVSLGILRGVVTAVGGAGRSAFGSGGGTVPPVLVGVAAGVVVAAGALMVAPSTALVAAAVLLLGDAALRLIAVRHRRPG
jgi:basic amino acid/polyamine antiporter, APA family